MASQTIPVYIGALMIAGSGGIGGILNSVLIHSNAVKATAKLNGMGLTYLINLISGVAAALFSWSLYGPLSNVGILGNMSSDLLTIPSVIGAALVGYSGSSWLTTHADKQKWQENTQKAIEKQANLSLSKEIPNLGPDEASKKIDDAR
jgi:hypothetical protein